MTEFAVTSLLFLVLVFGIIDFGIGFASANGISNAARVGSRYAAVHPTAWSNAASPAANTIQGQTMLTQGLAHLTNDDSHIVISYWVPSATLLTASQCTAASGCCGYYQQSGGRFQSTGLVLNGVSYSQANCVTGGNLIQVAVRYDYNWLTPLPGLSGLSMPTLTLTSNSWMLEEQ